MNAARNLVLGAIVIVAFSGFLYSVMDDGVGAFEYYQTLGEFNAAIKSGKADLKSGLRLHGVVSPGTIKRDVNKQRIAFILTDEERSTELPVLLTRLDVSDLFKDEALVVVEGRLQDDGVFVAEQLQAKCPTKYEAPAAEKSAMNGSAK